MDISEPIVAAGIGGAATVTAALFQLYTALRVKTKADSRPKKTAMLRSSVAIAALMIASAVGGYVLAEFRQQQILDDARAVHDELRGMREDINTKLLALEQKTEHLARDHGVGDEPPADVETTVLARGPVDRACDETSGDRPAACDTASEPAAVSRTVTQPARHGDL
jgi:hypothetical protein